MLKVKQVLVGSAVVVGVGILGMSSAAAQPPGGGGGDGGGSGGGGGIGSSCTFSPISLAANTLDDPWPDNYDEIRLTGGSIYYRHDNTFRGQLLKDIPSTRFSDRLDVNLTELDGGVWWNPNDNLGSFTVDKGLTGEHDHDFSLDGASYHLDYTVTC